MSRLLTNAPQNTVGPGMSEGLRDAYQPPIRTLYVTGVFGGATVKAQLSPDGSEVADADSRWLDVASLAFTVQPEPVTVQARFRKARGVVTGGNGTTSITMEFV
jgi:hypothetical protein